MIRGGNVITVKMLKPYYVKEDQDCIRLVLAYQYFSILLDDKVYHFVPLESKEIKINRKTKKPENVSDYFVFQKGTKYSRIALSDLIKLPDFLTHLHSIVHPYLLSEPVSEPLEREEEKKVIEQLELENAKRLIDVALDNRNYDAFLKWSDYVREQVKL